MQDKEKKQSFSLIKSLSNVNPVAKTAFFACLITGLIAHGYAMTNNFLTYDSMWNIYSNQNMISSGRQFLTLACGLGSYFDLPWVNGLLALLYLSVTAAMLTQIFGMERKISGILTGALLASFPAVTSTFFYSFTVDGYMLAVLLSVLAFIVCDRTKWGFLAAVPILGFSIGIYQSYISVTIIICITILLMRILTDDVKSLLNKSWRYVVMGAGSYLFYFITLKLMLAVEGQEMSGYQGSDAINGVSSSVLMLGLKNAFNKFRWFAMYENVLTTFDYMKIGFVVAALVATAVYIILFIKNRAYKNIVKIIAVLVLVALIPFGATLAMIISPYMNFHLLMRLPWVIFFVFAVRLAELFETKKEKRPAIYVNAVAIILLVWGFIVTANIGYFNMNERYEKTYATCVRMVDRLERTPGYKHGDKVAVLGGNLNTESFPETDITKEYMVGYFGGDGELCVNSTAKYAEFMKHYLGVTITTIPDAKEIELTTTDEFKAMPNFPAADSIQKIDDVWVIRING